MATPSSGSPAAPSATPNVITLHILSPAPEVTGGRITFPSISLETTISQLKGRLQNSIAATPPPERQRLIYRGRALVDGTVTLKTIFQAELTQLDTNNTTSNHTLHLVLPPTPLSNNTSAAPSLAGTVPTVPQGRPVPLPGQQIHHGPHFPHQAIVQAQAAQLVLQNQLNLLQQQLSMSNPVHASVEQMVQMQAHQHQRIAQQMATQHLPHHPHPTHHLHQAPQEQARAHGGTQDGRNSIHFAQGHPNQSTQTGQSHLSGTPLPMGPTTTTIHEGVGPNGSRMRVVVNETVNYHISRQGTPVPPATVMSQQPSTNVPFHAPPNAVSSFALYGPPGGLPSPPTFPLPAQDPLMLSGRPSHASPHGQHGASNTSQAAAVNTTAWLLSTPTGPQALVFAPGHGYFSSAPPPTTAHLTSSNRSTNHHSLRHDQQQVRDHVGHAPAPPNNQTLLPAGNGANAAPAQAVARLGRQQQQLRQANNNENDILQFIFQRGWLFLRLYIFMFVLSEPGTWRRWILLAVAVTVCLLPRENALRSLWNRIRAHIEGLVPIAAAPDQRRQGQAVQNGGEVARPAASVPTGQPSPEQAAARIIRQNQERQNHGIVRDTVFRIERAVALFLASLIPGVGERHVRAREEARREAERIENERLAAEHARAAEETAKNEDKATPDATEQRQERQEGPSATSTGDHSATSA